MKTNLRLIIMACAMGLSAFSISALADGLPTANTTSSISSAGKNPVAQDQTRNTPTLAEKNARTEVNKRINELNERINAEAKRGAITPQQAEALHQEARKIRQEAMQDEAKNSGILTREQVVQLNNEEQQVSQNITGENHPKK